MDQARQQAQELGATWQSPPQRGHAAAYADDDLAEFEKLERQTQMECACPRAPTSVQQSRIPTGTASSVNRSRTPQVSRLPISGQRPPSLLPTGSTGAIPRVQTQIPRSSVPAQRTSQAPCPAGSGRAPPCRIARPALPQPSGSRLPTRSAIPTRPAARPQTVPAISRIPQQRIIPPPQQRTIPTPQQRMIPPPQQRMIPPTQQRMIPPPQRRPGPRAQPPKPALPSTSRTSRLPIQPGGLPSRAPSPAPCVCPKPSSQVKQTKSMGAIPKNRAQMLKVPLGTRDTPETPRIPAPIRGARQAASRPTQPQSRMPRPAPPVRPTGAIPRRAPQVAQPPPRMRVQAASPPPPSRQEYAAHDSSLREFEEMERHIQQLEAEPATNAAQFGNIPPLDLEMAAACPCPGTDVGNLLGASFIASKTPMIHAPASRRWETGETHAARAAHEGMYLASDMEAQFAVHSQGVPVRRSVKRPPPLELPRRRLDQLPMDQSIPIDLELPLPMTPERLHGAPCFTCADRWDQMISEQHDTQNIFDESIVDYPESPKEISQYHDQDWENLASRAQCSICPEHWDIQSDSNPYNLTASRFEFPPSSVAYSQNNSAEWNRLANDSAGYNLFEQTMEYPPSPEPDCTCD